MRQIHPSHQTRRSVARPGRILLFGLTFSLLLLMCGRGAWADSAAPTRTTLAVHPADPSDGGGATLTATVRTATGSTVTAGTVDFELASGQSLGSAVVAADGTATLVLSKLPVASTTAIDGSSQVQVAAVFSPAQPVASSIASAAATAAFTGSRSVATAVTSPAVTNVTPDFTVTGNPTTVTAKQGSYGTTVLTVASVGGYAGSIQLSCSGLPAQVTCAFNPTQQLLGANGSFTSTLQLQTQGPSGTATSSLLPRSTGIALALAFPGMVALFGLRGRYRYRGVQMLGAVLLLVGAGLGLSGCSQRYSYLKHPPSIAGGTPIGTFPITVAVDGDQGSAVSEHDLTVSLVVQ